MVVWGHAFGVIPNCHGHLTGRAMLYERAALSGCRLITSGKRRRGIDCHTLQCGVLAVFLVATALHPSLLFRTRPLPIEKWAFSAVRRSGWQTCQRRIWRTWMRTICLWRAWRPAYSRCSSARSSWATSGSTATSACASASCCSCTSRRALSSSPGVQHLSMLKVIS